MEKTLQFLTALFEENRNEANAGPMKKYMKDRFSFLGIRKPQRSVIQKAIGWALWEFRKQIRGQ